MSSSDVGPRRTLPDRIGRYRVVERIGQGAMGVVYRAEDEAMGREVAIKLLLADLENEPEIRARFLREAEAAAKLSHPNIITIYDVDEDHGRVFMVMELLRGATLKDFLAQPEAAPIERKLDVMIQLGAGLGAAHNIGIFHRDIKPGNLFVRTDGILKILDFGVARLASSSMTAAGFVVGTPDFMSPEQARGLPIDGRSDIFSAGGVFYYMVTGRKPFAAANLPAIFRMVLQEDPPAPQPSEAPPDLARIIMKALAKDRDVRYQNCQELIADLNEVRRRFPSARRAGAPGRSASGFDGRAPAADPTPAATPRPSALDIDRTTMTPHPISRTAPVRQPPAPDEAMTSELVRPRPESGTPPAAPISTSEATLAAPVPVPGGASEASTPAARSSGDADDRAAAGSAPPPAAAGATSEGPAATREAAPPASPAVGRAAADRAGAQTLVSAPPVPAATRRPATDAPAAQTTPTVSPRPSAWTSPAPAVRSRTVVWGGAAAAVLVVAIGSMVVLRNRHAPLPVGAPTAPETAAAPSPPAATPQPAVQPETTDPQIAQHVADARAAIDREDFAGALDDLRLVLDRDPQHAEAASLKRQAEDALARMATPAGERAKLRAPDESAAAGIQRLPNESSRQYEDRVKRVKARYAEGRLALERKQFGAAIASFQAVDRDQPNYRDVRSLLADAVAARSAAFREAMDQGARSESAEQWKEALDAYLRAEQYDTGSTAAEKARVVRERLVSDATAALQRAHTYQAMRKPAEAVRLYQQVIDSLPEGHALRDQALQRLRALKP